MGKMCHSTIFSTFSYGFSRAKIVQCITDDIQLKRLWLTKLPINGHYCLLSWPNLVTNLCNDLYFWAFIYLLLRLSLLPSTTIVDRFPLIWSIMFEIFTRAITFHPLYYLREKTVIFVRVTVKHHATKAVFTRLDLSNNKFHCVFLVLCRVCI